MVISNRIRSRQTPPRLCETGPTCQFIRWGCRSSRSPTIAARVRFGACPAQACPRGRVAANGPSAALECDSLLAGRRSHAADTYRPAVLPRTAARHAEEEEPLRAFGVVVDAALTDKPAPRAFDSTARTAPAWPVTRPRRVSAAPMLGGIRHSSSASTSPSQRCVISSFQRLVRPSARDWRAVHPAGSSIE